MPDRLYSQISNISHIVNAPQFFALDRTEGQAGDLRGQADAPRLNRADLPVGVTGELNDIARGIGHGDQVSGCARYNILKLLRLPYRSNFIELMIYVKGIIISEETIKIINTKKHKIIINLICK